MNILANLHIETWSMKNSIADRKRSASIITKNPRFFLQAFAVFKALIIFGELPLPETTTSRSPHP